MKPSMKHKVETVVRSFLIAIIMFNMVGPSVASAAAQQPAKQEAGERTLPAEPARSYYEPAELAPLPQVSPSPTPVKPGPKLPARRPEGQLSFSLTPDSAAVQLNQNIVLTVTIQNNGQVADTKLAYLDKLEPGLEYVASSESPVSYDSQKRQVTYAIASLGAGESITFSYTLKVTAKKKNSAGGGIRIHDAELRHALGQTLITRVPFAVDSQLVSDDSSLAAFDSADGWHKLGKVSVYMKEGTLSANSLLVASPRARNGRGPAVQFDLEVLKTDAIATDASGEPTGQEVSLLGDSTEKFKGPAFIEINLKDQIDLSSVPAGQSVYVATYDETHEVWVKVPILAKDLANDTVTVQAAHFSTWGAGIGSSLPQNGANVLLFDQPYTSLFTGSAQYSVPIWMPAGRNGMTPSVSLSYSSGGYNGVLGDIQAPWVGGGWNIDGTEVVRKVTTSDTGYGYENSFALTVNGTKYDLIEDTVHPGLYNTRQSSFLYIRRHNAALGGASDAAPNTGGEWWEVVTTDGTRYRLGWNPDSEQLAPMYGYSCTVGNPCTTPDGTYATLGYAGKGTDLVALRWRVDRISDTHDNTMTYTYDEEQPEAASQVVAYDRASYLETISYTGTLGGGEPGYQVKFDLGERSAIGDNIPNAFNVWDNYDTKYLDKINICYGTCSPGTTVRLYDLNYHAEAVPNSNGTLVLDSIDICGGALANVGDTCNVNITESGETILVTKSPTIRFAYRNLDNRAVTGGAEKYTYPRLETISNGYGGSLTYTYGNDGRGTNSWYNWRVSRVDVHSGVTTSAVRGYTYTTPVYTDGATALAELIGYTDVTDTTYDFNGTTEIMKAKHHFGTADPDTGYEMWSETTDAGATVYNKTVNTYITDNSKAPFPGWNYRYLYQTDNYIRSAGALVLNSKTRFRNDPATGALLVREDYKGASLYRKQYYEHLSNFNPAVYILGKVTRELLVDASNAIYADTRYHYDAGINVAPVTGKLKLTQRVLSGSVTSDTSYTYDQYGNMTGSCSYAGYGTLNTVPSAAGCQESTTVYDSTLHTYPISSSNALGFTSSTDYLYTLGVPYRSTDPNGWQSSSTYDGLGRSLSSTAPGLSQAGVKFTYPVPSGGSVTAPYSIKMEILDTFPATDVYRSVWGMYDGLGRIIQSQVKNDDDGLLLVSDTDFNAQGAVKQQSTPHYLSGTGGTYLAPDWDQATLNTYDFLGRLTQVTAPGNITSTTQYDGLTTTSFDPNGHKSVRVSDQLGRMTQVQETKADGSTYATTNYSYDISDRLIKVTDAQNNVTTLQYDLLGRKTNMDDPDMGVWSYEYNALGGLLEQTDARSQVLEFSYDDLNRLTQKKDVNENEILAGYIYGTEPGEKGMRIGMTDTSGSAHWDYSDYGRSVTETRTIGTGATSTTKSFTSTSDWLGRPLRMTYPDADVVTYQYNALGQAESLQSSAQGGATLAELAYNQLGQITDTRLGNGALVSNTYDESGTYRLLNRRADMGATNLMDFSYQYDNAGNITQLTDGKLGETHTYQYDSLDRLTFAQAVETVSDDTIYKQTFTYDKIGNILQVNNATDVVAGAPGGDVLAADNSPDTSTSSVQRLDAAEVSLASYKLPAGPQPRPHLDPDTETPTPTATATVTPTPTPTATYTPEIACTGTGASREVWTGLTGSGVSSLVTGSNNFNNAPNLVDDLDIRFEAPANDGDLYGQRIRALLCVPNDAAYTFWITGDESASLRLNSATRLDTTTGANWTALAAGATQIASLASPADAREWDQALAPGQQKSAAIELDAGYYYIEARMKENTGDDHLAVSWKMNDDSTPADGDGTYIIPAANLVPPSFLPTATPTFTLTAGPSRTPTLTKTRTPTRTLTPTAMAIPSLVSWWKLDEASGARADSFGANTLTDNNTVTSAAGKQGSAADFELSNSEFLEIADNASLSTGNVDFSIAGWFNMESKPASWTMLISKYESVTVGEYLLAYTGTSNGDRFYFQLFNSGGTAICTIFANNFGAPSTGVWYYMVGWHDAATDTCSIQVNDGTPNTANVTAGQVPADTTANFRIGTYTTTEALFFDGLIDEVAFYKRALTSTERTWLYNNGSGRSYSTLATLTPTPTKTKTVTLTPTVTLTRTSTQVPGLVGHWNFDEASGATVNDGAGTAQNGTLTGGVRVLEGASGNAVRFSKETFTIDSIQIGSIQSGQFSAVKTWNFDTTVDGWTVANQVTGFAWISGGYAGGTISGGDPYLSSASTLGVTITGNPIIKIRLKNITSGTLGQFYFITNADTTWNAAKSKSFDVLVNSDFTDYTIDMSNVAGWTGTLHTLRFDPAGNNGALTSIQIPYHADLQPTNGLSVSAWFYIERLAAGGIYTILNKGGANQDYVLQVNGNGNLEFRMNDLLTSPPGTQTPSLSPASVLGPKVPLNTWTMVTGVYDKTSSQLKLYVNGVKVGSKLITGGTLAYDGSALYIGYTSNTWVGVLDEVRLYNGALTDAGVTALLGTFATPTPVPASPTTIPGSVNLALHKTASQSSNYSHGCNPTAAKAVDGITNTYFANCSVSLTNSDAQAWWQVDLGQSYAIGAIELWSRTDCCAEQLSNFKVYTSTDATNWTEVYSNAGPNGTQAGFSVSQTARYVKVQLQGTNYLALAEVKVWSAFAPTPTHTPSSTATGTPPTPTPIGGGSNPWGTGNDGNLTIAATSTPFNINVHTTNGRSCADGVAYAVTSLGSTVANLSTTPAAGCLNPGDEVMLINVQDPTASMYSVGNYEFLRVAYVTGSQVSFTAQKVKFYGTSFQSDAAVGTGAGNQKVMLIRVPNYNNVTVNGTLTGSAWDGAKYGILAFRVKGSLTGSGTVSANGIGYNSLDGYCGMSPVGAACTGLGGGQEAATVTNPGYDVYSGGGGYGTAGENGVTWGLYYGGSVYGNAPLDKLYAGSAGGYAADLHWNGNWYSGVPGGRGGGIVWIAADTINMNGSITSNGANGADTPTSVDHSGSGSGGSIRIEANTITSLSSASALGGTVNADGGVGRIAVYYQSSLGSVTANPSPYTAPMGQAPTPTASPTPITHPDGKDWGNGADGSVSVAASQTLNISTHTQNVSRSCSQGGDALSYNVIELGASYARVSSAPAAGCLNPGDEIMLISVRGTGTNYDNVGRYEFLRVGGVSGDRINFTTAKANFYGANAGDDTNIGTGATQQQLKIQRVPNYQNVTIGSGATLTGSNMTLAFRVKGSLTGSGTVSANGLGYESLDGYCGSSPVGTSCTGLGGGQEAATVTNPGYDVYSGGGGYGTAGENGGWGVTYYGGTAYGTASLDKIFAGGAGAYAADLHWNGNWYYGVPGGKGGGIVWIAADTINMSGSITSNGANGADTPTSVDHSGSGAGGSIRIEANTITSLSSATVNGGTTNADGGLGRIAVYYWNSASLGFSPGHIRNLSATPTPTFTPTKTSTPYLTDLALNKSTTADSYYGAHTPSMANNGVVANAWISVGATRWWQVDLGAVYNVNQFVISHAGAAGENAAWNARAFNIQVSTNGSNWTTAVTVTDNSANVSTHNITPTNARYVKVTITQADQTGNAYARLYEVVVSGAALPTSTPTSTPTPTATPVPTNPGTTNLVSWWTLAESSGTRDDSHGSNDLTDNNSVTSTGGKQGMAAKFTLANSEYLDIADNASVSMGANVDMTACTWVKLDTKDTAVTQNILSKRGAADGSYEYFLRYEGGGVDRFRFMVSSNGYGATLVTVDASSLGSPAVGAWYYLCAGYDGANLWISVNNGSRNTAAFSADIFDGTSSLFVSSNGVGGNYLNGTLDEAVLYKKSLSTAEVNWLYNNGEGRSYADVTATVPSSLSYTYDSARPHAVAAVADLLQPTATPNSYEYDLNGNMTTRTIDKAGTVDDVTTSFTYNAENRSASVTNTVGPTLTFISLYDGDGKRVAQIIDTGDGPVMSAFFMGGNYEVTVDEEGAQTSWKKYYSIGGQMMMDSSASSGLEYFLTNHQGSIVATLDAAGVLESEQRYMPFGQVRTDLGSGITQTDFGYTGQRNLSQLGLMDYKARFYDPYLNRFLQPDMIIPGTANPQAWNRFSYTKNNPVSRIDPSGHDDCTTTYAQQYSSACKPAAPKSPTLKPSTNNCSKGYYVGCNGDSGGGNQGLNPKKPAPRHPSDGLVSGLSGAGWVAQTALSASHLTVTPSGSNVIITGGIQYRNLAGFAPKTNIIGNYNPALFSASRGASSALGNTFTWVGIGMSVYGDVEDYQAGVTDGHEFAAAVTVDVASGLVTAAIAGAVSGFVAGAIVGSAGAGVGAVPGAIIGAVAGTLVAVVTSEAFQQSGLKAQTVNAVADAYRGLTGGG